MFSSQNIEKDITLAMYREQHSVFRLKEIAIITGLSDFQSLNKKLNYAVRTGKIANPRKGIYSLSDYDPEELACKIFTPSYISLEYVLQQSGVIFQYDSGITSVSYLAREVEVDGRLFRYRKIKGEVLTHPMGIRQEKNHVNVASSERAFLDLLYLAPETYFDNINPLNSKRVHQLLPIYQSNALVKRAKPYLRK
jgi:hypothetical protein